MLKLTIKRKKCTSRDSIGAKKCQQNVVFNPFNITHKSRLRKHKNQRICFFLLTKQINFCICKLALSNCHVCDNGTSKRPANKYKECHNRPAEVNIACVWCVRMQSHPIHSQAYNEPWHTKNLTTYS